MWSGPRLALDWPLRVDVGNDLSLIMELVLKFHSRRQAETLAAHLLEEKLGDLRNDGIIDLVHKLLLDGGVVNVQLEHNVVPGTVDAPHNVQRVVSRTWLRLHPDVPGAWHSQIQ